MKQWYISGVLGLLVAVFCLAWLRERSLPPVPSVKERMQARAAHESILQIDRIEEEIRIAQSEALLQESRRKLQDLKRGYRGDEVLERLRTSNAFLRGEILAYRSALKGIRDRLDPPDLVPKFIPGGVLIKGRVAQKVRGATVVECDFHAEGNQVIQTNGVSAQAGWCEVVGKLADRLAHDERVQLIGEEPSITTFTNRFGELMQMPRYAKVRFVNE